MNFAAREAASGTFSLVLCLSSFKEKLTNYAMANTAGLAVDRKPTTPVRAGDQNIRSQVVLVVDIRIE